MVTIAVLTTTRAEYGLLAPIIKRMQSDGGFRVQVLVTGAHLSEEQGLTYRQIETDGIDIDRKLDILQGTQGDVSRIMARAMVSFADYFADNRPDALLLLGDRYETLAVACAAMNQRIPMVHLYGGETTEGAIDEAVRHSLTKLSYLHMTSTEVYRKRVIQLGESPDRVYTVGAMGVENALRMKLMTRAELSDSLHMPLQREYAVATYHPVTLEEYAARYQADEFLRALDSINDMDFIITKANMDAGGSVINAMLEEYAAQHSNVRLFSSLGMLRYLSAVKHASFVLGNSSSGLLEAPALGVPTVNIGSRQRGRLAPGSVVHCDETAESILRAVETVRAEGFRQTIAGTENPYGDGRTSERIVAILKDTFEGKRIDLKKTFYDIDFEV